MLHTRTHKSRMVIMIKQLMPECTSCVARVHSGLCGNCPHWTPECGTGVNRGNGRENIRHNWAGEYHKAPTREMLNKNK